MSNEIPDLNLAIYRKKPVEIKALHLTAANAAAITGLFPGRVTLAEGDGALLEIATLEGVMKASEGDYIIIGIEGEVYPCKPGIFHKTYDKVTLQPPSGSEVDDA